ncbi:TonB-dependent receptor [Colwellia piezophila]|uniref:TonB-dependent receptor n=1 Tax=Colwellia piezophila TaxID=211668 RepID=UPI000376C453|nr:TonB-dependent receptor [Colwellia piezophila]
MKKSKLSLALLAAIAVQLPTYAFAAEATGAEVEVQSAKEKAAAKKEQKKLSDIEVITVGGMRASEVAAINMKKFSDTISDNLSAEDVGALPDLSIAESLERLSAVTGNQDNGRSNTISVRGMGGAYTLTTLNNREIVSSFGSRSINLSLFPSASIRRAQVYKTARADGLEGGISGHINMETFKPLEVDRNIRMVSATINGNSMYMDIPDTNHLGTTFDAMFSQHIGDDFAFSVGGSTRDDMRYLEGFKLGSKVVTSDFNGDGVTNYASSGAVLNSKLMDIQQDSVFVSAQWQLSDDLLISGDYLHSSYDYQQQGLTLSNPVFWGVDRLLKPDGSEAISGGDILVAPDAIDIGADNNYLMSGLVRKAPSFNDKRNTYDGGGFSKWDASVLNEDQTEVFGVNFEYFVSDNLVAELDISHSSASRFYSWRTASGKYGQDVDHYYAFSDRLDGYGLEYLGADSGTVYDGTGTAYNEATGELDRSKLSTAAVADTSTYTFNTLSNNQSFMESAVSAIKLDFTLDVDYGLVHKLKFGMRHSENTKDFIDDSLKYDRDEMDAKEAGSFDATFGHLDMNEIAKIVSNKPFQQLTNLKGFDDVFYIDAGDIINLMPEFFNDREPRNDLDKFASYELREITNAAYIQASFAGDWYDGVFGVRYYETKLEATSWQSNFSVTQVVDVDVDTGEETPTDNYVINILGDPGYVTNTNDYSDFLPTLNVNFRPSDEFVIRVGIGKAMIRPSLGDINNALELKSNVDGFDPANGQPGKTLGDAGNPYLMPITSTQFDISFEYYPSNNSNNYYSIASFYKDLDGIYEQGAEYIPIEGSFDDAGNQITMPVTTDVKAKGGSINGWETSFRQDLSDITDYLDGFSVSGNYMKIFNDATQDYNQRNPGDNALNVPTEIYSSPHGWLDSTYNVALTYDKGNDFSARLNLNQQSAHNTRDGGDHFTQLPNKNLSFSIRYRASKQIVFNAQAANLTNEVQTKSFLSGDKIGFADPSFTAQETARGVTYYAGIRVNF